VSLICQTCCRRGVEDQGKLGMRTCLMKCAHALVACLLAGELHARVASCLRVGVKIAFAYVLIFLEFFINFLNWSQKVASCTELNGSISEV